MPESIQVLVEQIGEFIQYWGFRKVDGMIWALIYLSAKPLSGQDLADRLELSKGMVSISLNTLLQYGVVKTSGRGSGRTTYYESAEDLDSVITSVLKSREAEMLKRTHASARQLQSLKHSPRLKDDFSPQRIQSMSRMINRGSKLLNLIIRLRLLRA